MVKIHIHTEVVEVTVLHNVFTHSTLQPVCIVYNIENNAICNVGKDGNCISVRHKYKMPFI